MITASDTSISQTLSVFASYNLEVSFLVPTETGMQKSIMDAPENLRDYFLAHNIHDYSSQDQGTENKISKIAYLVFNDHVEETQISLYRPNTKNCDPRIWIYGLKRGRQAKYCELKFEWFPLFSGQQNRVKVSCWKSCFLVIAILDAFCI